jgi:CubicO group peptidase (beta-lactamase class C family)
MEYTPQLTKLVQSKIPPEGPGVAVGIYRDGGLVGCASAGLANVEFTAPVDEHTRFDTASVSKQFTAAAALLLCRDRKLSLDDPLQMHLPELRLPTPITVGQCLRHTAGLPDWLSLAYLAGRPLTRITQEQVLAFIAELTGLNFEPGSRFSYSNTGYVLVASLVHRVSGMPLGELASERIFGPLGMHRTLYREDTRTPLPLFANGYEITGTRVIRADTEECAVGDGGLVTSIDDLSPWFGFLQDGRILGADLKNALLKREGPVGEPPRPYAQGLAHLSVDGQPAFGHSGSVPGYRSQLLFLPEAGLGVAVLSNNSSVQARQLALEALRLAIGPAVSEAPRSFAFDPAIADALVGYWLDPVTDTAICVERSGSGQLTVSGTFLAGQFALTPDGTWQGLDDSTGTRLQLTDEGLRVSSVFRPGDDSLCHRCDPPTSGATPPTAVYRSPELGTLATITGSGDLELGHQLIGRIEAAPDGAFTAGDLLTLRVHGDRLLVSTEGVYRTPFIRQTSLRSN